MFCLQARDHIVLDLIMSGQACWRSWEHRDSQHRQNKNKDSRQACSAGWGKLDNREGDCYS